MSKLNDFITKEQKDFLEKNGIAICNIVKEAIVPKKYIHDPSDTVLFESFKKNKVQFKVANPKFKELLKNKPIFFTCREKKGIRELLICFLNKNKLKEDIYHKIYFLKSPTRCNPKNRSLNWLEEMKAIGFNP